MKSKKSQNVKNRENEKGAAMVMALLVSFLLLVASAGILLESSMNTANVTDATADQQAYNAAESGIQSAINVLRGNRVPNPLLNSSKPASDPSNSINFVRALTLLNSNKTLTEGSVPRLSRWIDYNSTYTDRVTIGESAANPYTKNNGYAFSLALSDPDNTSTSISYTTTGRFFDSDVGIRTQKTYGTAKIVYVPTTVSYLDVSSGIKNTDLGSFVVTPGVGTVAAYNRFEITVNMTFPYVATRIIRGFIEKGSFTATSAPKFIFDSQTFTLMGSTTTVSLPSGAAVYDLGPPQRVGYEAPLQLGNNTISVSMTPAEPTRLLIRSTGYGPRGATKQLEAIIQKNFFNGLSAPATLTLVGPPSTSSPNPTSNFVFNPGSSNVTVYSGDDVVSTDIIAPIGTTSVHNADGTVDNSNLDAVQDSVDGQPPHPFNGTVVGTPSDISQEMPDWLQNPLKLETAIQSLYSVASKSGSYFRLGQTPTDSQWGNNATGKGITFVDHDVEFGGGTSGGGILVVTGKLTLKGNFSFNGLIIVTGAGGIVRSGGGNGTLQGNVVVAPYAHSQIIKTTYSTAPLVASDFEDKSSITASSTFLAPRYDLSGGGSSNITYNSSSVANGLTAVSNFALGVAEK